MDSSIWVAVMTSLPARTTSEGWAVDSVRRRMALARARGDLAAATHPAHRRMLEAAIAALTDQLREGPP